MVESNRENQSSFPQYLKILSRFNQASWSLPWAHLPTEENRSWDTEKNLPNLWTFQKYNWKKYYKQKMIKNGKSRWQEEI